MTINESSGECTKNFTLCFYVFVSFSFFSLWKIIKMSYNVHFYCSAKVCLQFFEYVFGGKWNEGENVDVNCWLYLRSCIDIFTTMHLAEMHEEMHLCTSSSTLCSHSLFLQEMRNIISTFVCLSIKLQCNALWRVK